MTFISVLEKARSNGLRLNNLCQLRNGYFRANWRFDQWKGGRGDGWFSIPVEHVDALEALRLSLDSALVVAPRPGEAVASGEAANRVKPRVAPEPAPTRPKPISGGFTDSEPPPAPSSLFDGL